jgi:hypothetical protein
VFGSEQPSVCRILKNAYEKCGNVYNSGVFEAAC